MRLRRFMPDVSLPWANLLYNLANTVLVTGAVLVLIGTIGTVWMGLVKENYGDQRIAANEALTATANEEAAKANLRAAALEKETALARTEQERIRERNLGLETELAKLGPRVKRLEPRILTNEQSAMLVRDLASLHSVVEILSDGAVSDAQKLGSQLAIIFEQAGWVVQNAMVLGVSGPIPVSGMRLSVQDINAMTTYETLVKNAFEHAGVPCDILAAPSVQWRSGVQEKAVSILVTAHHQ